MEHSRSITIIQGTVVEEQIQMSLGELCQACMAEQALVLTLVVEGVLEPLGETPHEWRFGGDSLRRATLALRLLHDLELNPAGVALALDLLDEIAALRARLQRLGSE